MVMVPIEPLMKDLYNITERYYSAKKDLVTLALARKASASVLTHLAKQHPTEIDLRAAQPIPPFALREHQTHGKRIPAGFNANKTIAERIVITTNDHTVDADVDMQYVGDDLDAEVEDEEGEGEGEGE
ncbi:hypothetical protein BGZ83_002668, partial [Gryganskiella cystojenkinii]